MGSFFGHVLPGTFFIVFALWWTVQAFRRYFKSLRKDGAPFRSTPTFKVHLWRFGLVDIEAKLVVLMCALGIVIEVVASPIFHHGGIAANNAQHATMYFFYGLVGLLALVLPRVKLFPAPGLVDSLVYASLVLAYAVEAGLFKFHLFGRDDLDVVLHTLLIYAVYACVVATLNEMRVRDNILATLSRAYFTMLQGTWFWHGAWVLYNPITDPWGRNSPDHDHHEDTGDESHHHDPEHMKHMMEMMQQMVKGNGSTDHAMPGGMHGDHDHEFHERVRRAMDPVHDQMMMATMAFAWHMAAIFVLMLVIGAVIGRCYKNERDFDFEDQFHMHAMSPSDKGYKVIRLQEEDEDREIEADRRRILTDDVDDGAED